MRVKLIGVRGGDGLLERQARILHAMVEMCWLIEGNSLLAKKAKKRREKESAGRHKRSPSLFLQNQIARSCRAIVSNISVSGNIKHVTSCFQARVVADGIKQHDQPPMARR